MQVHRTNGKSSHVFSPSRGTETISEVISELSHFFSSSSVGHTHFRQRERCHAAQESVSPSRSFSFVSGPLSPPQKKKKTCFVKAKLVSAASVGLGLLSSGLKKLGRIGGATGGVRGGRHKKSR